MGAQESVHWKDKVYVVLGRTPMQYNATNEQWKNLYYALVGHTNIEDAFLYLASTGDAHGVEVLIDSGAVDPHDRDGVALKWAVACAQPDVVNVILSRSLV